MPLLPLRALPVNDAHDGPLTMRVDVRPTGSAYVYVRRESDKKTWICKVRTVQEILAPSHEARSLGLMSVIMCLYNGAAYDTLAYTSVPIELRRREVAFAQPETWTDDGYRLTMRVVIRSPAIATSMALSHSMTQSNGSHHATPVEAIPVVDVADDDVVFGLNFSATTVSLDHVDPPPKTEVKKRVTCLRSIGVAFPCAYLNFPPDFGDQNFTRVVGDGVRILNDGWTLSELEVTVDIVHAKDPVLFALSVNSQAVKVLQTTTYQPYPGGDIFHTITQHAFKIAPKSLLQLVLLPGSAAALAGSSITIREPSESQF